MATSTLIISDLHVNSTVGLCKPRLHLDDGGSYHPGPGQKLLWRRWNEMLDDVARLRQGKLYVVCNGDVVDGDQKHRTHQVISRNRSTIIQHAGDILDPLVRSADGLYVLRGTEAHVGKSGSMEEDLAKDLGAVQDGGNYSRWYLNWLVDGVRMDIMHHPRGGTGARPMNKPNSVVRMASDALFEAANRGEVPPDLLIRSHLHQYMDSYDAFRVRAILTPAWMLATAYTYRLGLDNMADIGAVLVIADNGAYVAHHLSYEMGRKQWQSPEK